jgi:hypothetical protein
MLARLLSPDPSIRARRLSGTLAVLAVLAVGVHRADPALPFPLIESWALVGAGVAALLALPTPLGPVGRPIGALIVVVLLLRAGLPAAHNATFPWVELGRARLAEWEDLALFGLCLALVATGAAATAAERWRARGAGILAAVALGVTLFLPIKSSFQGLAAPAPGMTAVPVLTWRGPVPQRWTRTFTTGSGLVLFPEHVRDEWALMAIAGGIHQDAASAAVRRGEKRPWVAAVQGGVRIGSWTVLQWVAALAHSARTLAFPLVVALVGASLLGRPLAERPRLATRWICGAGLVLVPAANLGALVAGTLVWLPDGGGLRISAAASTLAMLALVGLVSASAPGRATLGAAS